jgi:hypothetical protein
VIQDTLSMQRTILTALNQSQPSNRTRPGYNTHAIGEVNPQVSRYSSRFEPGIYYGDTGYAPVSQPPALWIAPPASQPQLSPTEPGGFRDLFIAELSSYIEKRSRDFQEMNIQSSYLGTRVISILDTFPTTQY